MKNALFKVPRLVRVRHLIRQAYQVRKGLIGKFFEVNINDSFLPFFNDL